MIDIYFEKEYGRLYERAEDGVCETFEYGSDAGKVYHIFIRRRIPVRVDGELYYDLVTPYGYGGPVILGCHEGHKRDLIDGFASSFREYCKANNVVSEFVRFHPIINNADDFGSLYRVEHIRNTVGTNLKDFGNPFDEEFSKSARQCIRRALRAGVECRIVENPENLDGFKKIYYATMERNVADAYYFFDDDYFAACVKYFKRNMILAEAVHQERVIAAALCFVYGRTIHVHLSGTLGDFLALSPAYVLRYGVILWGMENGFHLVHHGGGVTNDEADSLYQFKKRFGKNTEFRFCVGKKVWNAHVYERLCRVTGVAPSSEGYFPAYRRKVGTNDPATTQS